MLAEYCLVNILRVFELHSVVRGSGQVGKNSSLITPLRAWASTRGGGIASGDTAQYVNDRLHRIFGNR